MKKIIRIILIALVVLIVLAVLAVHLFLDGAIKSGVESIGPTLTKTEIKLNSVGLSLLSGSGKIKGLVVGNPEGFKTPSAISVGNASLELQPRSLLSDKVIIKSISVEGPEITFETDLKSVNLKMILNNLEEATGGSEKTPSQPKQPEAKAGKKLEVGDFLIKGGKVHVSVPILNQSATVNLPEIHLQDLGKGPDGITAAELSKRVLTEIVNKSEEVAAGVLSDMMKGGKFMTKDLGISTNAAEKVTKGLGDLNPFKKKP
jgi:uncharacterized protein involved in outer membrane biogenesis